MEEVTQRVLRPQGNSARATFPWDALLKWSAFLITIAGLVLHVAGSRYHEARMEAWGIDADLFPKPVEWVLMAGYYVIVGAIAYAYLYFKTYWWKVTVWGVCGVAVCFVTLMLALRREDNVSPHVVRNWLKPFPRWLLALGFSTSYMSVVCVFIVYAPLLFASVLYLPSQLGQEAGAKAAKMQVTQYSQECAAGPLTHHCIVFKRDDRLELNGFLLESSASELAIYLPRQKVVQVLKREGLELTVAQGPVLSSADKAE